MKVLALFRFVNVPNLVYMTLVLKLEQLFGTKMCVALYSTVLGDTF